MSYDDTRTVKQKKVGDIEVSIEGGAYCPDSEDQDAGYWSEDPSVWSYWVEVVKWGSDGGRTIKKSSESNNPSSLETTYKQYIRQYLPAAVINYISRF